MEKWVKKNSCKEEATINGEVMPCWDSVDFRSRFIGMCEIYWQICEWKLELMEWVLQTAHPTRFLQLPGSFLPFQHKSLTQIPKIQSNLFKNH